MSKEKQIEEMANAMCSLGESNCQECATHWEFVTIPKCDLVARAERLYNAGYRKQSVGEWKENVIAFCNVCSVCKAKVDRYAIKCNSGKLHYCPNCGARMGGGE